PHSLWEAKHAPAPISLARAMLQETKNELKKMEEQQEMRNSMLEQLVTETANQLNEKVRCWGSTPTTRRLRGGEEQEKAKAACSNCTFDYRVLLGQLVQRCEKLEEEVDSLESRQTAVHKVESILKQRSQQDRQLLQHMEDRVKKIQGECEQLSLVSGNLQKDCEQKQKDIEV
ncbi:QRIC2 protein, partial [Onychorhynchus coronatus]|nr:QRIC2 protein [Onychorhynchus coronatus]